MQELQDEKVSTHIDEETEIINGYEVVVRYIKTDKDVDKEVREALIQNYIKRNI